MSVMPHRDEHREIVDGDVDPVILAHRNLERARRLYAETLLAAMVGRHRRGAVTGMATRGEGGDEREAER